MPSVKRILLAAVIVAASLAGAIPSPAEACPLGRVLRAPARAARVAGGVVRRVLPRNR